MQSQSAQTGREGLAIASMVLGIIALATFCVIYLSLPAAITAIVMGALSLRSNNRGMALAGVICGSISAVLTLLWVAVLAALIFGASSLVGSAMKEMPKAIATSEIVQEVKTHYGPGTIIQGGDTAVNVKNIAGQQWEGTGRVTQPGGKSADFDVVMEIGPQEGQSFHRTIRFSSR